VSGRCTEHHACAAHRVLLRAVEATKDDMVPDGRESAPHVALYAFVGLSQSGETICGLRIEGDAGNHHGLAAIGHVQKCI
jgi:hypothetical protein